MQVQDFSHVQEQGVTTAGDAAVDLEVLKTVPKQFEITDEKSANWLVKQIMQARAYAQRVKEWADAESRRAAREEHTLMFLFGRQIEDWAKGEVGKLNGRRKSLNLPGGTVGFRSNSTKIVIDDEQIVLAWARENLPTAVVVVEKLAKTVVNEYAERTGVIPEGGIHIEPAAEKFYIR